MLHCWWSPRLLAPGCQGLAVVLVEDALGWQGLAVVLVEVAAGWQELAVVLVQLAPGWQGLAVSVLMWYHPEHGKLPQPVLPSHAHTFTAPPLTGALFFAECVFQARCFETFQWHCMP